MSPSREFRTLVPCFWNCLGNSLSNADNLKFPSVLSLCQKCCFILHFALKRTRLQFQQKILSSGV